MPIIGTIASSYLQSTSSYESIQTITVTGSTASSIDFSTVPSGYKHLQLRITARSIYSVDAVSPYLRFNGDSNSNYILKQVYFDGTSNTNGSNASSATTAVIASQIVSNYGSGSTNIFSPVIIDITDYANTNKFKTVRSIGGWTSNGTANYQWQYRGGIWRSTNAITSINITVDGGGNSNRNFEIGSVFALYGIKGK